MVTRLRGDGSPGLGEEDQMANLEIQLPERKTESIQITIATNIQDFVNSYDLFHTVAHTPLITPNTKQNRSLGTWFLDQQFQ